MFISSVLLPTVSKILLLSIKIYSKNRKHTSTTVKVLLLMGCLFCILTENLQLESSEVFKHYREVILRDKSMLMASEIISQKQLTKYLFIWLLHPILPSFFIFIGFSESSVGKESACNARDPGLIPGSGRSLGEGIGYPLQYSWASLLA